MKKTCPVKQVFPKIVHFSSYSWAYTSWTYFRCENGQSCCGNAWNRYCCNKSKQNSWLWLNLDPDIAGCLLYGAIFLLCAIILFCAFRCENEKKTPRYMMFNEWWTKGLVQHLFMM